MPSDEDNLRNLRIDEIYQYRISLYKIESLLKDGNTSASETASLLAEVTNLKDVQGLTSVGKSAEKWREYIVQNKNLTGIIIGTVLNDREKEQLLSDIQRWTINFENRVSELYIVTPVTDMPPDKLVGGPSEFLNVNLEDEYQEVLYDLTEACYNLVIGTYTSSEFMCLRAVERLVRNWYKKEFNEEDIPNWYGALQALEESDNAEELSNIRLLDILRERRNQLAHPDERSSRRDSETTLKQTFTVVEGMVEVLDD